MDAEHDYLQYCFRLQDDWNLPYSLSFFCLSLFSIFSWLVSTLPHDFGFVVGIIIIQIKNETMVVVT